MKSLLVILSAAAIILLTACDEETPTNPSNSDNLRSINVFDLNSRSIIKTINHYNPVRDIVFYNNSTFIYVQGFGVNDGWNGTAYGNKIIMTDFTGFSNNFTYFAGLDVNGFSVSPQIGSFFFSADFDIYRVNDNGNSIIKLTNRNNVWKYNPIYSVGSSLLIYGYTDWQFQYCGILGVNVLTNEADTLLKVRNGSSVYLLPLFIIENSNRLIYSESNDLLGSGSIKSLNLLDHQDINVIATGIPIQAIGKNISSDGKMVFSSDGKIYTLDLNNSEMKFVTDGMFADISNDGNRILFATPFELFLINSDGSNPQKLTSKLAEKEYISYLSFSPDNERIVFLQSKLAYDRQYIEN
jgi:hypothetical protein